MVEVKVSLTIALRGRVMMSEQECSKNPKENYDEFTVRTEVKKKIEFFHIKVRKNRPASQVIKLTEDAYKAMTAKSNKKDDDAINCPYWSSPNKWFPLSKKQRLEAHLQRICDGLGGTSYSYEVFED